MGRTHLLLQRTFFSLAPVSCQAQLLCAAKLAEASFLRISLPRPAYPPSSFLHPSAIAPSCGIPRCLGVLWQSVAPVPLQLRWPEPPFQRAQLSLFCLLGRPGIHLSCTQLPGFTFGLALSLASKWTNGRWQEEGWEETWQADGVNMHTTFPRETWLKRSFLPRGHQVKELYMRNAVCDLVQEPTDIYTVI